MSVYIELVFFNNFFIDVMLVYATVALRRRKFLFWRAVLASIIGAVCAVAYAVLPVWARLIEVLLLAPVVCAVAIPIKGKSAKYKLGDFIASVLVFVLLTYFMGGITYGLSFAFNVDIRSYAVLGLLAIAVIALIACARLFALKRSASNDATVNITVKVGGRTVSADALCDSGNLLVDEVSGLPIVILSQKLERELCANKLSGFVSISTVSGEDELPLVDLDEVCVKGRTFKALGALSRKSFDSFDLILQNSMF